MKTVVQSNGAVKVVTDVVELGACYLNPSFEFDTKFGSINANIVMTKEDYEGSELEGAILACEKNSMEKAKKEHPKAKNQIQLVAKAIPEVDDNGDETGRIIIKLKNKAKFERDGELFDRTLIVVDAHKNPVENYTELTAGTKAKVSFTVLPYYMASRKEAGISCWLNGLQIIQPEWYEGGSDFDDEEDGWEAPKTLEQIKTEHVQDAINNDKPVTVESSEDEILDALNELP